ncbi:MAG: M16 family metallopeptidase, partial [Polyangiaceae bacterium]
MGASPAAGCATLVSLLLFVSAAARAGDDRPSGPRGPLTVTHLANGMTVAVQEDHRVPLVALALSYDAGRRASPPGLPGIAALTTSLMLRATQHVKDGDYFRLLSEAGATMSDATNLDHILFDVEVPSNRIELPLWLWSDQMGFFDEALTDAALESQRSTSERARKTWLETAPLSQLDTIAREELFPTDHPYRNALVGAPEDVRGVDRKAVVAFHDAWIRPEHAFLAIVGDVVPGDAAAVAGRYFGTISGRGAPGRIARPPAVTLQGETIVDVAANVPRARVDIYWPTARFLTTEDARLDIVAHIFSGVRTSLVYWDLVDKQKVATRVWTHQYSADLGSIFEVNIELAPGHTPPEGLAAFDAVVAEILSHTPQAGVVGMAGYEMLINRAVNLESPRDRARQVCSYFTIVGEPNYFAHDFNRYDDVPGQAVNDAITRLLPPDRRVVLL